jgi:hypothetical protein
MRRSAGSELTTTGANLIRQQGHVRVAMCCAPFASRNYGELLDIYDGAPWSEMAIADCALPWGNRAIGNKIIMFEDGRRA